MANNENRKLNLRFIIDRPFNKLLGLLLGASSLLFCPNAFAFNVATTTAVRDFNVSPGNPLAIPTTTTAQSALNAFIASTGSNNIDFDTSAATGLGAVFASGALPTLNGITFSTTACVNQFPATCPPASGATSDNGVTSITSGAAVGFGTTGTYNTGAFARFDPLNGNTFTLNFTAPVSQFGFIITDFGNTPTGLNTIDFVINDINGLSTISSGGNSFGNGSDTVDNNARSARFVGVRSESGAAVITSAIFTINRPSTGRERFGIDDIRINTQAIQPIPFEFESATGLILIGGYFVGKRYLKNRKA